MARIKGNRFTVEHIIRMLREKDNACSVDPISIYLTVDA